MNDQAVLIRVLARIRKLAKVVLVRRLRTLRRRWRHPCFPIVSSSLKSLKTAHDSDETEVELGGSRDYGEDVEFK